MAKSLRSKWRRKMRAIKRIRYGVKELDRLKKMLVNAGEIEVKEGGEVEHICLVKAKNEEAEKIQLEKEEKSKVDKTAEPLKETTKKVQHPTWLRKKEYKKYIRSYRKQQSINAKRIKGSLKKKSITVKNL
ncbi:unnamed protein product [Macrosiphum euphorbiae]|uniref:Uncharacterized protein n=1 Tax=Macrosiphum euphorbiae TaxID=13131 RepID=A0AAV0VR66_9HEMI|nr:unnamed protein product [Macrosiphum euphorbiae]